ncbi:hypothetical protein [Caldicellulosiruptor changbaiensis]|nr:hypothetical protein [Caldicellulosiruptor changbaiensis]
MDREILIRTEKNMGKYPRLNQIVIGYLKGFEGQLESESNS